MKIPDIRLQNQQLLNPLFRTPKELVSWMGAVQAQNYTMVKWAVGMRLKSATVQTVEKALKDGEILRTHVMRPTWHLVAAEDIRWMLKLSAQRIKAANDSFAKGYDLEIIDELFSKSNRLLEKILCGNKSLTKQEITEHFCRAGIVAEADNQRMTRLMARAEQEGIVCSGEDKGGKFTYALLEERVPSVPELTKDESLARLARSYFRSHAPAVLQDFVWWSGLPVSEARQAIYLINSELTVEQWHGQIWYIHEACRTCGKVSDSLHLLPSYDEYLLGYKDRTDVLPKEHYSKAFTNNGLFYPVILHKGQVVGNWDKSVRKKKIELPYSWFAPDSCVNEELVNRAKRRYLAFLGFEEPV
ncbi:winged helix DNA-binding domain-containing protein [uncultured Bacteroides sp.]|uniref:winged helix DNA-binding domain-containing protein n=1 Tax=uncultured Bacteroides sp. TaxID=162156 RepID=UPI0025E57E08|nr:winged helix DNA-binding domain-containing protein [uncultured Bacteroides sp.]